MSESVNLSVKTHLSAPVQYIDFERYKISVSDNTFSLYDCNLNSLSIFFSVAGEIPSILLMCLARAK